MQYSLSNGLSSNVSGIDADARAYITAVETALGTPIATALPSATSNPKRIISDFIKAEKAASRWSLHKRIFLPIYANAAASAIDMVDLNVGTFIGGVTHAAGYVATDGTSGHFLADVSVGGAGCTLNGTGVYALYTAADTLITNNTQRYFGAQDSNSSTRLFLSGNSTTRFASIGLNNALFLTDLAAGDQRGIQFLGRNTSLSRFIVFRSSSLLTNSQLSLSSAISSTVPMCWLAGNNNGTIYGYLPSVARLGASGMTEGMSQANAEAFTLNLKTLWESLTGLTLP